MVSWVSHSLTLALSCSLMFCTRAGVDEAELRCSEDEDLLRL